MKKGATISVLLNLALAGGLVFVWLNPRKSPIPPPLVPARTQPPPASAAAQSAPPVAPQGVVEFNPFRWSQLEPTNDYEAYVANLRASGCPEATVEDIVRGDAQRAFSAMRRQLRVSALDAGPWSALSQLQTVAGLLGRTPPAAAFPGSATPVPSALAAFLQNADFTPIGLDARQQEEFAGLRQALLDQISRPSPPPAHPAGVASVPPGNSAPSSPAGANGAPPSGAQSDTSQGGTANTGPSQTGTDNPPARWRPQASQSVIMAEEAESMIGGLFGMGAAMQYQQTQAAQAAQQSN